MTAIQRSLQQLRKDGYLVCVVEKWIAAIKQRKDAFGFGDLLAVKGDETILVQTTSGSNASARVTKIRDLDEARIWCSSPNRKILVHGWAKRGKRGKVKRWTCRVIEVQFPKDRTLFDSVAKVSDTVPGTNPHPS